MNTNINSTKKLNQEIKVLKQTYESSGLLDIRQKIVDLQKSADAISRPIDQSINAINEKIRCNEKNLEVYQDLNSYRNKIQELYNSHKLGETFSDVFTGSRFCNFQVPGKTFQMMEAYLIVTSLTMSYFEKLLKISQMFEDFGLEKLDLKMSENV